LREGRLLNKLSRELSDFKQLTIKPQDLGFDAEAALETFPVGPAMRTDIRTERNTATKTPNGSVRQNLMLYPGE
jgi:hypothetical protein